MADIPAQLRRAIEQRAGYRCEYCLLPQRFAFHKHEPDHLVPMQHGGETEEGNLALACLRCNRYKGPNVGSFDPLTGRLVPFFHPRSQSWTDHFAWAGAVIIPLTPEGRVTAKILRFNDPERVEERRILLAANLYLS